MCVCVAVCCLSDNRCQAVTNDALGNKDKVMTIGAQDYSTTEAHIRRYNTTAEPRVGTWRRCSTRSWLCSTFLRVIHHCILTILPERRAIRLYGFGAERKGRLFFCTKTVRGYDPSRRGGTEPQRQILGLCHVLLCLLGMACMGRMTFLLSGWTFSIPSRLASQAIVDSRLTSEARRPRAYSCKSRL